MTSTEIRSEERRALELLPWYVNGTLEGAERELVSRQVLTSISCRKELARLRRLQQLIQHDDAEAAATDRAFERLMARIDASDGSDRSRRRQAGKGKFWMRLALAASLAAAVPALWLWWAATPDPTPRIYETLTAPVSSDSQDATLRVLFAPDVSEPERRQLLASHGLRVVGSPTEDGIVTLAFAENADRAAIVAALKQDPRVRLVTSPPESSGP